MPGAAYRKIYDCAEEQNGYLTVAQARAAGVTRQALTNMAARGSVDRVSWGLYRLVHFPATPLDQYVEATLWAAPARAVISHETALMIYELSDVNPAKVHVTLPRAARVRREMPAWLVVHRADLRPEELDVHEGIPITTPERAIRDCHATHLGPALVRQAIRDGARTGRLGAARARALETELLGSVSRGREEWA